MEFITVEQFKEQPKEVQRVFLDWWECEPFDLYAWFWSVRTNKWCIESCHNQIQADAINKNKGINIPLFTEGQLRKFIEDKFSCENIEVIANVDTCQYEMYLYRKISSLSCERHIDGLGDNILQAYWKVACIIAEEETE